MRIPSVFFVGLAACVSLMPSFSRAASVTVTNYVAPGFVIDSEASRDFIGVEGAFAVATALPAVTVKVRAEFSLLDAQGLSVLLADGKGGAVDTVSVLDTFSSATVGNRAIGVRLRPARRLIPGQPYRVRMVVRRVVDDSVYNNQSDLGAKRTYIHFRDTIEGVGRSTVGVVVSGVNVSREHLVTSIPDRDAFSITPAVDVYRYDIAAGVGHLDPVPVHLNVRLINEVTGLEVPLATNRFSYNKLFASTDGDGPSQASLATGTLSLRPAGPLPDVTESYRVEVSAEHEENAVLPDGGASSAAAHFMRLNGSLWFGTIRTEYHALNNNPTVSHVGDDHVVTTLNVSAGRGRLPQWPDRTFGGVLNVRVYADGRAEYAGPGSVPVAVANGSVGNVNGMSVEWGALSLSDSGLSAAGLTLKLPGGFGYSDLADAMILEDAITFPAQSLDGSGKPTTDTLTLNRQVYVMEESKPVRVLVNGIHWRPALGRLEMTAGAESQFVRLEALTALEQGGGLAVLGAESRTSNDHLFRSAQVLAGTEMRVIADSDGQAQMSTVLTFGAGKFRPHFPYSAFGDFLDHNGGTGVVTNDLFDPARSAVAGVDPVKIRYDRGCPGEPGAPPGCSTANDFALLTFLPGGGNLRITRDGGLQGDGSLAVGTEALRWGKRPVGNNQYAHQHFGVSDAVSYLMAGNALTAGHAANQSLALALGARPAPGVLLLSGMLPAVIAGDKSELPGTVNYVVGQGDYPGINVRVTEDDPLGNRSYLGNSRTPEFPLSSRSKYYVRGGGVSGIHDAQPGFALNDFDIYGYTFQLDNFSLGLLDNANPPGYSLLNGSMVVDHPAEMNFQFGRIPVTCSGQLTEPQLVGTNRHTLGRAYWHGDLTIMSTRFEEPEGGACDGDRILTVNVGVPVSLNEDVTLFGTLGLANSGQLTRAADNFGDKFASRLKMPTHFTMPGPADERYHFTALGDAYFNHQASHAVAHAGFLNLPGEWKLPFFQNTTVHVHAKGNSDDPLYEVMDGVVFRDDPLADPENQGFMGGGLAAYRKGGPRARQGWLGFDRFFDYELDWNSGGRSFAAQGEELNLFILNSANRVTYLSPRNAELNFGVEYGNLPRINLAGIAFDALDRGTGFAQNLVDALEDQGQRAVVDGIEKLAGVVGDRADFLDRVIEAASVGDIDALCTQLEVAAQDGPLEPAVARGIVRGHVANAMRGKLAAVLGSADADTVTVLEEVTARVDAAAAAVDAFQTLFQPERAGRLVRSLVAEHAPDFVAFVAGALGQVAAESLIGPEMREVERQLQRVENRIGEVRSGLRGGDGLVEEITAYMNDGGDEELQALLEAVSDDAVTFLERANYDPGDLGPDELKDFVRRRLRDRLYASTIVERIQHRMRQSLFDVNRGMMATFDSALMQINETIREIIASHLAEADDEINGILGGLADKIGSGRLRGYAHIEGDALRELRLDGAFRLNVPDDMGLEAYLRIKQMQSEGAGSCGSGDGVVVNEIEMGANDIAINWGSGELRASLGTKFWIQGREPIGMGGSFEMTGGDPSFGTVTLTDLAAAMGFANGQNFKQAYFAGAAGMEFEGVALSGGAFFGSTCSLEPIQIIDPDVGELLDQPPFTGGYVYGQGRIPIVNYGCAFRISAGVGSGFFYFAEGPTYGGKLYGEVKGEALCAVTIKGDMTLIGVKQGDNFRFRGRGGVGGKVGPCPFCLKFRKSITVTYDNGWDVDY